MTNAYMQISSLVIPQKKAKFCMSSNRYDDFKMHIEVLKKQNPLDVSAHLLVFDSRQPNEKMICKFFMVSCTADKVREDNFRDFITTQIVRYVTKSKFIDPKKRTDSAYIIGLHLRAKKLFMKRSPTAAECGELILFILLESQGIMQILQKMRLKTHREMAFHGSDGVYVELDDGLYILHFGESKMVGTLEDGVRDAIKSIENFYNKDDNDKEHELELELVSAHIDDHKFGGFVDLIEDLVLPYGKDQSKVREKSSVFIGYTWDLLSKLPTLGSTTLTQYLQKEYPKLHEAIAAKMASAVQASPKIKDRYYHVQFIPFTDAVKFRTDFKAQL